MEFTTPVHIDPSPWTISHKDRLLTLGSCFSDNIARKTTEYGLRVTANPFGTLYNPISIAHHMTDQLIAEHDVVIITFGTAWVYIDKCVPGGLVENAKLDAVVDNCQKRPATDFTRYRLTVEDIVRAWQPILERYQDKRFIFTVSPIRHKKDGLHENQISKGILLQAIDYLCSDVHKKVKNAIMYFPSYEIVLDELRDYRFYADDMLHPSTQAINYIWERFSKTYLPGEEEQRIMREIHQYYLDSHHRMLNPDSVEAQAFAQHLEKEKIEIQKKYPWIQ